MVVKYNTAVETAPMVECEPFSQALSKATYHRGRIRRDVRRTIQDGGFTNVA